MSMLNTTRCPSRYTVSKSALRAPIRTSTGAPGADTTIAWLCSPFAKANVLPPIATRVSRVVSHVRCHALSPSTGFVTSSALLVSPLVVRNAASSAATVVAPRGNATTPIAADPACSANPSSVPASAVQTSRAASGTVKMNVRRAALVTYVPGASAPAAYTCGPAGEGDGADAVVAVPHATVATSSAATGSLMAERHAAGARGSMRPSPVT